MGLYDESLSSFKRIFLNNEKNLFRNAENCNIIENYIREAYGSDLNFKEHIFGVLKSAKIFKIDDSLLEVFLNTDLEVNYLHPPFDIIFLETKIKISEDEEVQGIFVMDSPLEESLSICFWALNKTKGKAFFNSFGFHNMNREIVYDEGELPADTDNPLIKRKLCLFVIAFLKFLFNPDVEIMKKEYTPIRKKRRVEQGKPVYDHYYLKITGKTRKYIDDFSEQVSRTYQKHTDSWIVRGYYKTFTSDRYKKMKGQTIFVAPYVVGLGEVKDKPYIVTEKKKLFYNQTLMENLVKEIFPQHLVLRNTRGFLDGLEIDCYIPDLKLGFEYNGEQHYQFIPAFHETEKDFREQQKRDKEKNKIAKERGIRLITIKYDEELTKELILNKVKEAGL